MTRIPSIVKHVLERIESVACLKYADDSFGVEMQLIADDMSKSIESGLYSIKTLSVCKKYYEKLIYYSLVTNNKRLTFDNLLDLYKTNSIRSRISNIDEYIHSYSVIKRYKSKIESVNNYQVILIDSERGNAIYKTVLLDEGCESTITDSTNAPATKFIVLGRDNWVARFNLSLSTFSNSNLYKYICKESTRIDNEKCTTISDLCITDKSNKNSILVNIIFATSVFCDINECKKVIFRGRVGLRRVMDKYEIKYDVFDDSLRSTKIYIVETSSLIKFNQIFEYSSKNLYIKYSDYF